MSSESSKRESAAVSLDAAEQPAESGISGVAVPCGRLGIRRNFCWMFAGNVVYAVSQWGMLVALAKLGNPHLVGLFAFGLAVAAPVIMLSNMQLAVVQAADARRDYPFCDYFGLRLLSTVAALVFITLAGFAVGRGRETALVVIVVGLAKSFEAVSDIIFGLFQQLERMDRIARSLMLKGPVSLAALAIVVYLTGSVLYGSAALLVVWAVMLFVYDIPWAARMLRTYCESDDTECDAETVRVAPRFRRTALWKLTRLAFPLGIVMMLISLNTNVPRYFVEHYLGTWELGIFAAVAYLMTAGRLLVNSLGQSAIPRLAGFYADGKAALFRRLVFRLVATAVVVGTAGVIVALLAGRELLTLLYKSEYARYSDVFTLVMIAAAIWYVATMIGHSITAARFFKVQMPLLILTTGVLVVSCLLLVPRLGLDGAGTALIITSCFHTLGNLTILACVLLALHRRQCVSVGGGPEGGNG